MPKTIGVDLIRSIAPAGSWRALAVRIVAAALLGAVVGVATLSFTSDTTGEVGPGTVAVQAGLGRGGTVLHLPPFGDISADTHRGPLTIGLRVDGVDVDKVQGIFAGGDAERELRRAVEADLRPLTKKLVQRSLLLAAVVGAVAGAVLPRRRWYSAVAGSTGAIVAVSGLLMVTWSGFDAEAFVAKPVFNGPLAEAPRVVGTVLEHVESFEEVQDRYAVLSGQIAEVYSASIAADTGGPSGETRILHVSDIHLNPVGLEVVRQLAREFRVHAVLDTGDLTSFGEPVEAAIVPLVEAVAAEAPYLYVSGNHDSPENIAAIAGAENVTLLDGTTADVGPVRILGVGDPTFTPLGRLSAREMITSVLAAASDVPVLLRKHRPDLLAVHNPRLAWEAGGLVPYAVAGHMHTTRSEVRDGMLLLTIGSAGSEGLGEFTEEEDESRYEAEILRFAGDRLVAVDRIVVQGRAGSFQIAREVIDHEPIASGTFSAEAARRVR